MSVAEQLIAFGSLRRERFSPSERAFQRMREEILLSGQIVRAFDLLGIRVSHEETVPLLNKIASRLRQSDKDTNDIIPLDDYSNGKKYTLLVDSRDDGQTTVRLARFDSKDGDISTVCLAKIDHQTRSIEVSADPQIIKSQLLPLAA